VNRLKKCVFITVVDANCKHFDAPEWIQIHQIGVATVRVKQLALQSKKKSAG